MTIVTPGQLAAELVGMAASTTAEVQRATTLWTAELQKQVQKNASGRPGPNAPTGDYRRSINRQVRKTPAGATGQVGSNKPQAARLEYGFVGIDSLGRSYNQPAYPHFSPALDTIRPKFEAAIEAIATPPKGRSITRTRPTSGR